MRVFNRPLLLMPSVYVYHKVVKGRGETLRLLLCAIEMVSGCFLTGVSHMLRGATVNEDYSWRNFDERRRLSWGRFLQC